MTLDTSRHYCETFWDIFDCWLTDREWPGQHLQFLRCFIRYTIYDDCNIFAGNRMESNPLVQYRLLGRDGFSAVRKTNTKKEKTSCRSNDKHKIQRRYEGSNICSICHNYGNFCQVKVTLLHKTFVAKTRKMRLWLESQRWVFNKALFFVIFGQIWSLLFLQLSQRCTMFAEISIHIL